MPKLWTSLRGNGSVEKRFTVSDYAKMLSYDGHQYPIIGSSSNAHQDFEQVENSFVGYINGAYKANGIVFACMLARASLFSEAEFQWRPRRGRTDAPLWTPELELLEEPWPNGTTGELLWRMVQDADLSGNFFAVREGRRLRRLRPDWMTIALTAPPAEAVESDVAGYIYSPGGTLGAASRAYGVNEIVHWSPIPDPDAQYRGMSWLTPVITEIQSDKAATLHKKKFFDNGAALQTVMTLGDSVTKDQFKDWVRAFRESHQGVHNAYEPLFLGGGADAKVVGADLKQIDFKATQGAGETRIAAAAGIHPVILGLSEGLAGSSLNAGNFGAARRLTGDKTLRTLWRSACAVLGSVVQAPTGARLWYDADDIAFLREDRKDLAEIQSTEGQTIRNLTDGGFEPESIVLAVMASDWSLLEHTGLPSVQVQPGVVDAGEDTDEGDEPEDSEETPADETTPDGGTGGGSGTSSPAAAKQRDVAETLQKVYLAVGKIITVDEARKIANKAGADLVIPGPDFGAPAPTSEPEPDEPAEPEPDEDEDTPDEGEDES